jgi:diguanylate cyclase (GGDEF)-like protein
VRAENCLAGAPSVTITEYLGKQPKNILMILGFLLIVTVSASDYLTHTRYVLEFSPFYLVPISFFSWFIGKRSGIALAAMSAAVGLGVRLSHSSGIIPYWNALVWFALYVSSAVMVVQLKRLYEHERQLSRIDPLTKIANRLALFEAAAQAKSFSDRQNMPISIAYLDVDGFKQLNDRHGHSTGDRILALTAASVRKALRPTDVVARVGGDEFTVLLPNTDRETAAQVINRVRHELARAMEKSGWQVTFSIGIATFFPPIGSVAEMIKSADKEMYAAKRMGKNRIKNDQLTSVQSAHNSRRSEQKERVTLR